jgi:hypothetical protein
MPRETPSKDKAQPAGPPKAKPAEKARTSKAKSARPAKKRLARVPDQYVFYCCDGGVYRDMAELAAGLAAMTDETFAYHSNTEKQDFCNWVRDIIEDIELAEDLALAASRRRAATCVAERIAVLELE